MQYSIDKTIFRSPSIGIEQVRTKDRRYPVLKVHEMSYKDTKNHKKQPETQAS